MYTPQTTRLLTWALIVSLPLWFGSCSKSGGDTVVPASIEGTWTFSGLKIDPAYDLLGTGTKTNDLLSVITKYGGADAETCFKTTKIIFQSGGKLSGVTGQKCSTSTTTPADTGGSWKLDGTKLTLTSPDGKTSDVYDTALSGNTLKLSQTNSDTDWDGDGKKDTVTTTIELVKA